ncbi:MAG: hypothetical protein ABW318_14890, partial [Vicinamibacterales bacterium]
WTDEQWTENGDHKTVNWKTRDWDTQMTASGAARLTSPAEIVVTTSLSRHGSGFKFSRMESPL